MSFIKAENLGFEYDEFDDDGKKKGAFCAFSGIDLHVEEGQFICIIGHNGSGKSTLAKHINALLTPKDGTIWVDGMDTKDEGKLWEIRQCAGMVFQNPDNQIISSVVEEDVGFGPENMGVPTKEIWERVDNALKVTGMTKYRKESPDRLSGGQKQRVAIAGVMAMLPKCIVLDEPTAMLDPQGRKEVLDEVIKLNKEKNITVILITHYMDEAVMADNIFVMDHGRIVMQGAPADVFCHVNELRSIGLEVPQMTALAYELKRNGIDIPDGIMTIEEMADALCRLR